MSHTHTDKNKECEICGIKFPHYHPDKTQPNLFTQIPIEQSPVPEEDNQDELWDKVFELIYGGVPVKHSYPDNITYLKSKYIIKSKNK